MRALAPRNSSIPFRMISPPPLSALLRYFLKLGTVGFGGPIALVGYMQADLVVERGWISPEEYKEGLAFSQLLPGPLATQLAMYLGWVRCGVRGATLVGAAFILPSFLMVIVFAALYVRYEHLPWLSSLFYSIGPAVIGIIAKSAYQLSTRTIGRDWLLWALFAGSAAVTVLTESEKVWVFAAAGLAMLFLRTGILRGRNGLVRSLLPVFLFAGIRGPAPPGAATQLFLYFTKVGTLVFGSGLAIVPFLHGGVVGEFHWLNERQFLDAIAVGMITPGPVVITSGFIGYLVAGLAGATMAAAGVFLPIYLFVILLAPSYSRFSKNKSVHAFAQGVLAAAVGGIAGAAVVLGRKAVVDVPTALIALAVFGCLMKTKRIAEPVLILIAGILGLAIRGLT